jgi:lipopolysaccharide transport system ATP-binding protein
MSQPVISVEQLSKKYRLGQLHTDLLSERLSWLLHLRRKPSNADAREDFWALRDINFTVAEGDVVGIIGRNGAGKSTLLKILSRLTSPTEGRAVIHGRLASLLEVGTGFHPELTGRENIYLNATILGMRRREIDRKFDEIVAFSGVEAFLDTPVKRYSSGMYVRLAFAVAAHVESEILVVDEVLAVGDAEFQKRCLGKMKEVAHGGRTVLFVSHNLAAIRALCNSGVLLDAGRVVAVGTSEYCATLYEARSGHERGPTWQRDFSGTEPMQIKRVTSSLEGRQPNVTLHVTLTIETTSPHRPALVAIDIADSSGTVLLQAIPRLEGFIHPNTVPQELSIAVDLPPLVPGHYAVSVWLGSHMNETLDEVKEAVEFEITESPTPGRVFPHTRDHGFAVPASRVLANPRFDR